ncbi:MAG: hypothetical protein WA110_06935 [Anaerolineaceae bacterium]
MNENHALATGSYSSRWVKHFYTQAHICRGAEPQPLAFKPLPMRLNTSAQGNCI